MTLITSYSPLPITFTHGKGVWLYDSDGNAYLDGLSGIAVCGLGHAHPDVTQTIQQQAAKLIHTSNVFHIETYMKFPFRTTFFRCDRKVTVPERCITQSKPELI